MHSTKQGTMGKTTRRSRGLFFVGRKIFLSLDSHELLRITLRMRSFARKSASATRSTCACTPPACTDPPGRSSRLSCPHERATALFATGRTWNASRPLLPQIAGLMEGIERCPTAHLSGGEGPKDTACHCLSQAVISRAPTGRVPCKTARHGARVQPHDGALSRSGHGHHGPQSSAASAAR